MIAWIRQQFERYRAWRVARAAERWRRWCEEVVRPENVAEMRRYSEKEYGRLVLDEDGFHLIKDGKRVYVVHWLSVRTIETYKRDMFAYDQICLAFEIGDDEWAEISESMVDFDAVTERMQEHFPGIPEDWYSVVMLPAFEPNQRVLWRRGVGDTSVRQRNERAE